MYTKSSAPLRAIRRRPLALCLCTAFAAVLSSSALAYVPPATWTVTTCSDDDSGNLTSRTGSLRFAVAHANGGSTIDLSQLPTEYNCSVITLGTGSVKSGLAIAQDNLTLQGPAEGRVTITENENEVSNAAAHLIDHLGTGILSVNNLTFVSGRPFDTKPVQNGCIYSKGTVALSHSAVCGTTILGSAVASAAVKGSNSTDDIATPEHPYLQSQPVDRE
jgi:hypothetical protein